MSKKVTVLSESPETQTERFCKNQIATKENPGGTDCVIWIVEGKAAVTGLFACPYQSAEHAQQGNAFPGPNVTAGGNGICQDFEPLTP